MRGGGSPQVVVNINDRSGAGTRKSVNQSTDGEGNLVIDVVIDAVMRNVNGSRNALRSALGVEG
jgi:phosphatidate phosphatase APP1